MAERNASEKAAEEMRRRGIRCEMPYTYLGRPDRFVIAGAWDRRLFRTPWLVFVTHHDGRLELLIGGTALTRFGARLRAYAYADRAAEERGAVEV